MGTIDQKLDVQVARLRSINAALRALLSCAIELADDRADPLGAAIFLVTESDTELEHLDEMLGSYAGEPAND